MHETDPIPRTWLYVISLISGMTTLAIEVLTSRLIGSVFGTSNIVWAAVIGMTLFYLMVGYFYGGRLADRYPSFRSFTKIVIGAGFAAGVVPILAMPLLRLAGQGLVRLDVGTSFGIALAVAVLFAIPMTLLGAVPPFAIRLVIDDVERSGQAAGVIYSLTTLGGILGAILPGPLLIPRIGTSGAFGLFAVLLVAAVFLAEWQRTRSFPWRSGGGLAIIVVASIILAGRPLRPPPDGMTLLHERETQYNYVQVVESENGTRLLLLNEGLATHSIFHPERLETGGSWDYFLVGPYFNAPPYTPDKVEKVAILGLAAGTVARQYAAVYGPVQIDGVEIDPGIVDVGQEYFEMTMPNLKLIIQDARYALNLIGGGYQMIGIDAYRPPYIPWQLTTVEFFEDVRTHLAEDGVVVINVGRTHVDRRLVEAMTATMLEVFPTVHTMDVPATFNTMLVATNRATRIEDLAENEFAVSIDPNAHPMLKFALTLGRTTLVPTVSSDLVFTDEIAPVENLADSIVLQFVLGDGAEEMRELLIGK